LGSRRPQWRKTHKPGLEGQARSGCDGWRDHAGTTASVAQASRLANAGGGAAGRMRRSATAAPGEATTVRDRRYSRARRRPWRKPPGLRMRAVEPQVGFDGQRPPLQGRQRRSETAAPVGHDGVRGASLQACECGRWSRRPDATASRIRQSATAAPGWAEAAAVSGQEGRVDSSGRRPARQKSHDAMFCRQSATAAPVGRGPTETVIAGRLRASAARPSGPP